MQNPAEAGSFGKRSPVPRAGWGLLYPRHRGERLSLRLENHPGARRERGGHGTGRGHFHVRTKAGLDLQGFGRQGSAMTFQQVPPKPSNLPDQVVFDRSELGVILTVYGRMVAAGEWRDYGMSFLKDVAIFSIFRRAAEHPIYRIEKRPRLRGRQGMYSAIGMDGQILKRGHDLKTVLRVFDRKLIRAVKE